MGKKLRLILAVVVFVTVVTLSQAFACTGVYIGKDVSTDGTTIIARSEDQYANAYEKMFKVAPAVTESGRYMDDTGTGFKIALPDTTYKYTYIPDNSDEEDGEYPACCTNEYGLAVIGTVTAHANDAYEAEDPFMETGTGLREAILPALIDCQCKTAREAVDKLAELVDQYGSEEGNILFFADQNEAWIFEIYGGHNYCAMKMPTDKVAVFGNQFMIGAVDQTDTVNYVFSKDLFSIIDKIGAIKENGEYNIVKSIGAARGDYGNMRTWIGHKLLSPSTVGDYSTDEYYPLFYTPDSKVSVTDVMEIYRNRYEGTEYDMSKPENESVRPIGVNTSSDIHIVQIYSDLPADSCDLMWLCLGEARGSVFIPSFSGITDTYKGYQVDAFSYDPNSVYWDFNSICTLAQSDNTNLSQGVRDYWKLQELMEYNTIQDSLQSVKDAYAKSQEDGRSYVTALEMQMAGTEVKNAKKLYSDLMTTAAMNETDLSEELDKTVFTAGVQLGDVASYFGYTAANSGDTYTLTSGSTVYTFDLGADDCEVSKNGTTSTLSFTNSPYMQGGEVYVPVDFANALNPAE